MIYHFSSNYCIISMSMCFLPPNIPLTASSTHPCPHISRLTESSLCFKSLRENRVSLSIGIWLPAGQSRSIKVIAFPHISMFRSPWPSVIEEAGSWRHPAWISTGKTGYTKPQSVFLPLFAPGVFRYSVFRWAKIYFPVNKNWSIIRRYKINLQLTAIFFVFGRSRVQISARRPDILTEVFHGLSQSLQANSWSST
jgi:hypothetical protein